MNNIEKDFKLFAKAQGISEEKIDKTIKSHNGIVIILLPLQESYLKKQFDKFQFLRKVEFL